MLIMTAVSTCMTNYIISGHRGIFVFVSKTINWWHTEVYLNIFKLAIHLCCLYFLGQFRIWKWKNRGIRVQLLTSALLKIQVFWGVTLSRWVFPDVLEGILGLIDPEDRGTSVLGNLDKYAPSDIAEHPRRLGLLRAGSYSAVFPEVHR